MRALMYVDEKKMELQELPMPEGEVILRVLGCTVCGTDLKTFLHGHPYFKPPTILGHEFYGRVEKAPADWTEAMKNSLLYPNREGKWHGLYLDYRLGQDGEWLEVGYENHGNFGERTVILPIFPSDYQTVKEQGCTLRLAEYCTTVFNGTPVGEDWNYSIPSGSASMQMDLQAQPILEITVPLP